MSVTATITQQDVLRDYTIRLTAGELTSTSRRDDEPSTRTGDLPPTAAAAAAAAEQQHYENPPGWDTEHRQVPPYRPVNMELDHGSRPWGSNPVESVIVFAMMHGVWLKGVSLSTSCSGKERMLYRRC